MKTAIYIEDGEAQMVLTPQNEFEKDAVDKFREKPLEVQIMRGGFYECRGGFYRQNNDESLILRLVKPKTHDTTEGA